MKKLIISIIAFFMIGCASTISPLVESNLIDTSEIKVKTDKLIDSLLSEEMIDFGKSRDTIGYIGAEWQTVTVTSKQNLSSHNYFDWHWANHTAILIYSDTITPGTRVYLTVTFIVKEYQEFLSPKARGFIRYTIKNHFAECKSEDIEVTRTYHMVGPNDIITLPIYPEGYINDKWFDFTIVESVKKYEEVLDYWLDKIEVGETEEEKEERVLDSLIPEEDC